MKSLRRLFATFLLVFVAFCVCCTKVKRSYSATLIYHVYPINEEGECVFTERDIYGNYGKNVMDNMIRLLSAEAFLLPVAEKLEGEILLENVTKSVTYAYQSDTELYLTVLNITVSVSEDDLEFGRALLACLKTEVSEYVSKMMVLPGEAVATVCELQNPAATILKN